MDIPPSGRYTERYEVTLRHRVSRLLRTQVVEAEDMYHAMIYAKEHHLGHTIVRITSLD
jgi:hypothetical protein